MTEFMDASTIAVATWVGIAFCVSQSAIFSGLNLAYFSVSLLRLEVEVGTGNKSAARILRMREDSNFLLTTILWGNVGINVLLTLLSNSVMAGVTAFLFSTLIITLIGEIFPQAYFSRNAMKIGAMLSPVMRFYQFIFYPVAKPIALLLDMWLGKEGVQYLRERDMREMIRQHMVAEDADLDRIEGLGALNFLSIDDVPASHEGEPLDPQSIIKLPFDEKGPIFPALADEAGKKFLDQLHKSGKKWIVLIDQDKQPRMVLDSDGYLRGAIFDKDNFDPINFCHKPIIVKNNTMRLGRIIQNFEVQPSYSGDNVIDRDVVLLWSNSKRVITGADILGRLLVGISQTKVK